MIYLLSDLHFGHQKDFLYGPRGFQNIYDHDKTIIENWNKVINPEDDVYLLGDVMLGDTAYGLSCLKQLKGQIHIIRGNHDSDSRWELYKDCWNVVETCEAKFLRYKKYVMFLSHYPTLCGNYDSDKPLKARCLSICGHTHTKDPFCDWDKGIIYHVDADAQNCTPILIDNMLEQINNKFNKEKR